MFDSDKDRDLEALLAPIAAPRPEHRAELESALLDQFDANHSVRGTTVNKKNVIRRAFFGAAIAAAACIAACAAPVEVDLDVGRSITVAYASGEGMPEPPAIAKAIEAQGPFDRVDVRGKVQNDETVVEVEVWGEKAANTSLEGPLAAAFPALASAKITETKLSGKTQSTLGKKIGHEFFDLDLTDAETAEEVRQKILADLAARGVEGEVNVQVDDGDGKKKIRVEVRTEDCEPPPEPEDASAP